MFLGLVIVMLMSSLNQTILAPSLPTIVGELHGVEHMSWVITIFILLRRLRCRSYGKLSTSSDASPSCFFCDCRFHGGFDCWCAAQMNWLILLVPCKVWAAAV